MQNEVIKLLTQEFTKARTKNPAYSLRAFSNRLSVQTSALSEILNGKRKVTNKMAGRILAGLGYNSLEASNILSNASTQGDSNLSLDYFKTISDWYYFAILSLAEIDDFKASDEWISRRLNISKKDAKAALARLIKLEMLVEDKNGNFKSSNVQYKTPTDILDVSLKNHTVQTLDLATKSALHDDINIRDFSTITMAIDTSKLDEAKKMIKAFRTRLSKKLESGKKKEVYKLAIQLFPLSNNGKED